MAGKGSKKAKRAERLADQAERDLIVRELDGSMLVEAAAGTGKTTSMVGRMAALLAEGKCAAGTLAAVTFTRKAAAELRSRYQLALEAAHREADGIRRLRLSDALGDSARTFIGTIHSFCARLLRERPVEAGVAVDFKELDETEDARLRSFAWDEYVNVLYAAGDPVLLELEELGLDPGMLRSAFLRFAEYPDVDEWPADRDEPAERDERPDLEAARAALVDYARHMEGLAPELPADAGNDKLIPKYASIPRLMRHVDLDTYAGLAEAIGRFGKVSVVQKEWPGGKEQALAELGRWNDFAERFARPVVEHFLAKRYELGLRVLTRARGVYDTLRGDLGQLNYQDLLMKAAALLREAPHVRRYFRERFTYVLVDEFQDTDPVQAEVMMLLTADDPEQRDWRKCRPAGGSLFVVGDPKQSIYRFRRADIVTYNMVRDIIERSGGRVVSLSTNFRATRPVIEWVNGVFEGSFPSAPTEFSPAYVPLRWSGKMDDDRRGVAGVSVLRVSGDYRNKEAIAAYEPSFIARTIRQAVDSGSAAPGDFMIVTSRKGRLGVYAEALQDLGVPHQVTGGSALNDIEELRLLYVALRAAVEPEDPVALVAALRSELFGLSDAALYAFKRAEGGFSFRESVPDGLDPDDAEAFGDAFARLRRYGDMLQALPPAAAVEGIAADLGLSTLAASREGGAARAGGLGKAVELVRAAGNAAAPEMWSAAASVDYLARIVDGDERHDGASARPAEASVVRVMNLHKVKGLEAPVVFLADPIGAYRHPVDIHVDRSAETVRGYLALRGERRGWGPPPLLARPAGWEAHESREREFQEAEAVRLLYVAATRAAEGIVTTQRDARPRDNPWKFFAPHLEDAPELPDPGPQEAPRLEPVEVGDDEPEVARGEIVKRWERASAPGYAALAARDAADVLGRATEAVRGAGAGPGAGQGQPDLLPPGAAADAPSPEPPDEAAPLGEHGTEWGSVIHALLEAAMAAPGAELALAARQALAQHGLELSLAEDAVATAKSVMGSDIWLRARASERRLVEVPFGFLVQGDMPTVIRGAIDLAFREAGPGGQDGWVIVDYKTDRVGADSLPSLIPRLVERHRPQLAAYAEAWRRCVREPVHEAGLYFVRAGRYVAVDVT